MDKGFFVFLSLYQVGEPSVMVLADFVRKESQGYCDIAGCMEDQPVSEATPEVRHPTTLCYGRTYLDPMSKKKLQK